MAGQPKTRAKREAAKKAAPKGKGSRARKPPARSPFDPATPEDFEAATRELLKAAQAEERKEPMTAGERVARDVAVISARALGLRPATIAERFGITADHVHGIIDAHRSRRASTPIPPSHALLEDALEELEAQMERVTLAASRQGASESAIVGAVRTWRDLWLSRLELLQIMDRISRTPSGDARERRARDLLRRLLDELHAAGVSQALIDQAANRVLLGDGDTENVVTIEGRVR